MVTRKDPYPETGRKTPGHWAVREHVQEGANQDLGGHPMPHSLLQAPVVTLSRRHSTVVQDSRNGVGRVYVARRMHPFGACSTSLKDFLRSCQARTARVVEQPGQHGRVG